jgi:predicted metalloendopeptidase
MRLWRTLALTAVVVLLSACAGMTSKKPVPAGKAAYGEYGLALDWRDQAVKPGNDFYAHAVGTWEAATQIPDERSSYGIGTIVADQVEADLHAIAEAAALGSAPEGSSERKIGDFYASYMDEAAIEANGIAPLKPHLDGIAVVKTPAELAKAFVDGIESFGKSPVGIFVHTDARKPDTYAVYLYQSGLGLPNREYYLRRGRQYDEIRAAYRAYVEQILALAGVPNARARAESILALETRIAGAHWSAEQSRDREKTYNPVTIADLEAEAPGLDWRAFAAAAGIEGGNIIALQKSALAKLARIARTTGLEVWKAYLTFHVLDQAAPFLPKAFDEANFAFRGKALGGRAAQRERWKRGVRLLDAQLGEAVGQLYVARRFPPAARAAAQSLVANLKIAQRQLIAEASWLDPATKAEAGAKLDAMMVKLGHPDAWRDYAGLELRRDDLIGNVARGSRFEFRRNIAKLAKPVDRSEWPVPPQNGTVYNDLSRNEIAATAAIMQPPFFDLHADPAVNYGEIGAMIGHELSRGFDDHGRRFDAQGKLRDWWTAKDLEAYAAEASKLAAQFDAYEPLPGQRVNGRRTLASNMADLAGLAIAYRGYKIALGNKAAPVRDGLSGDQRFFLAYAQSMAAKRRDESLREQLASSPQSPERYRVNGIVRNFDPWYAAFAVQPGDKLYLKSEERVRLWAGPAM